MKKLRIIIVDDSKEFRSALKFILTSFPSVYEIHEVDNGNDFVELIETVVPDIVFMDIDMPGISGIEATRLICKKHRFMKIIAVTFHSEFEYIKDMLFAGATSYLVKQEMTRKDIEKVISEDFLIR